MNYIVFDLEWNQGGDSEKQLVEKIPFEVIEIGAIKLDENKQTLDTFTMLIKPVIYKQLHYVTKKMLGITMEELEHEKTFWKVMKKFLDWCGEDFIFCTWGPLDLLELQRNMRYHKMPSFSDGPLTFLDVQKLFSLQFEDGKTRRSLESAIDLLSLPKDIAFHRALDDAYYTAKILQKINDPKIESHVSFDCFSLPQNKESEIHIVFDDYSKYISREFPDKSSAMLDREVLSTRCFYCNRNLRKKMRWFAPNNKHYLALSYCEKHGYMKSKIRIKKSETGHVYVYKTSRFISEEDVAALREKQEKVKKQKKGAAKTKQ